MYHALMPLGHRKTVEPLMILMVAINPKDSEILLLQPLFPAMMFCIIMPIQAKAPQDDDIRNCA